MGCRRWLAVVASLAVASTHEGGQHEEEHERREDEEEVLGERLCRVE